MNLKRHKKIKKNNKPFIILGITALTILTTSETCINIVKDVARFVQEQQPYEISPMKLKIQKDSYEFNKNWEIIQIVKFNKEYTEPVTNKSHVEKLYKVHPRNDELFRPILYSSRKIPKPEIIYVIC